MTFVAEAGDGVRLIDHFDPPVIGELVQFKIGARDLQTLGWYYGDECMNDAAVLLSE